MKKLFFVSILATSITLFSCRAIIGLLDENTGNSTTPSGSTPSGNSNKEIIELTSSEDFTEQVEQSKGYVIVDFYKGWCVNCLWVQYSFYQLLKEYQNVKFCSAQAYDTPYSKTSSEYNELYNQTKNNYKNRMDADFLEHWLNYGCGEEHQSCYDESYDFPSDIPFEGGGKNYTPTVILYKDGQPIARLGATQKEVWDEERQRAVGYCHTKNTVNNFLKNYVK